MASYQQYLRQIEDLKVKAEKAREKELTSVVADIRALMDANGVTLEELNHLLGFVPESAARRTRSTKGRSAGAARTASRSTGKKVPSKYRGPNGEEWTGRGRQPAWVKEVTGNGQPISDYLISPESK